MFSPTSIERCYRCVILGTVVFLLPVVFAYVFVSVSSIMFSLLYGSE